MTTLRALLAKGYFPFGIPQAFESRTFGEAVTRRGLALPVDFLPSPTGKFRPTAHLAKHNLARGGQLRRPLGIPNPILQFNLAREVVQSWPQLAPIFASDALSITAPVNDSSLER